MALQRQLFESAEPNPRPTMAARRKQPADDRSIYSFVAPSEAEFKRLIDAENLHAQLAAVVAVGGRVDERRQR